MRRSKRTSVLSSWTGQKETPLGTVYVTLGVEFGSEPYEVFLNVGKAGSDIAALSEALGRTISLVLQISPEATPKQRLAKVIEELAGIGGSRSIPNGNNTFTNSLPDGVSQALEELSKIIIQQEAILGKPNTIAQESNPTEPVPQQLPEYPVEEQDRKATDAYH